MRFNIKSQYAKAFQQYFDFILVLVMLLGIHLLHVDQRKLRRRDEKSHASEEIMMRMNEANSVLLMRKRQAPYDYWYRSEED